MNQANFTSFQMAEVRKIARAQLTELLEEIVSLLKSDQDASSFTPPRPHRGKSSSEPVGLPMAHQLMTGGDIAAAIGLKSPWLIYAVKKANRVLHTNTGEPLIFAGRYSTPAKVQRWLDDHPDFSASRVLRTKRQKVV